MTRHDTEIPHTNPTPSTLLRILVPLLILCAASVAAYFIVTTRPAVKKRAAPNPPPRVEWITAKLQDHGVTLSGMGTVKPATQIELKTRVGGQVEWISPALVPGGRFTKGEPLLTLDEADLRLSLATAEAKLRQARAELALEAGNQDVARNELALMEATTGRRVKDHTLALREPQLAKAEAVVALAEIEVKKAELDLSRATIRAPFQGIVLTRTASVGTLMTAGLSVAEITGDAAWWVEMTLPVRDLAWLNMDPKKGPAPKVRVLSPEGTPYEGHLMRILTDLSPQSRMARLLVEIKEPMAQAKARHGLPLLLNSYVRVTLSGTPITQVVALPEKALRDDSEVWVIQNGTLTVTPVELARREGDTVYIRQGLTSGDRVIITNLAAPVDGMAVLTETAPPSMGKKGPKGRQDKNAGA